MRAWRTGRGSGRSGLALVAAIVCAVIVQILPEELDPANLPGVSSLDRNRSATIVDRGEGQPYLRALYGGGWADENGDCRNTRAEILVEMSVAPVRFRPGGCSVLRGKWFDPYTGETFTQAGDLDIDHVVPLAWAHAHGADAWSRERKIAFANWEGNLLPVSSAVNRQKGADGPDRWLPPRVGYRCEYLLRFERVRRGWGLELSADELSAYRQIGLSYCPRGLP